MTSYKLTVLFALIVMAKLCSSQYASMDSSPPSNGQANGYQQKNVYMKPVYPQQIYQKPISYTPVQQSQPIQSSYGTYQQQPAYSSYIQQQPSSYGVIQQQPQQPQQPQHQQQPMIAVSQRYGAQTPSSYAAPTQQTYVQPPVQYHVYTAAPAYGQAQAYGSQSPIQQQPVYSKQF